jgi:hypothetical protein
MSFIWQEFGCLKSHFHGQILIATKYLDIESPTIGIMGLHQNLVNSKLFLVHFTGTQKQKKKNQNLGDNKMYFVARIWLL